MKSIALLHQTLTSSNPNGDIKGDVFSFAKQLGWNPSYYFEPYPSMPVNAHLIIEHGLENAAIISFLKNTDDILSTSDERKLLSLSYNNLLNWHITIDSRDITYYYVLNSQKYEIARERIRRDEEINVLGVKLFEEIIQKKPNPNIKALDDVLIDTIRKWRIWISAEFNNDVSLLNLSTLFNTIILFRSVEDNKRRNGHLSSEEQILIACLIEHQEETDFTFSKYIQYVEQKLGVVAPDFLINKQQLEIFDNINKEQLNRLIKDFYDNSNNNFRYDFSVMTKHALSRIYEKYVAILGAERILTQQTELDFGLTLAGELSKNKNSGVYYTPEYIARFFAKYLQENTSPTKFKSLKVLEPSVGSGIFLRTLLEIQIEQLLNSNYSTIDDITNLFANVKGIDKDPNACAATMLSLSLLYYVFKSEFPAQLNIEEGNSLENLLEVSEEFDAIISNPPYISADNMDEPTKKATQSALGELLKGKSDAYLAFLKLSINALKPNGYGLFILPYNFLLTENAQKLRDYFLEKTNIKFLADLSSISVFEGVSVYNVLLIIQKKDPLSSISNNDTWLLRSNSSVGEGLNYILRNQSTNSNKNQTYKINNPFKKGDLWYVLSEEENIIKNKIGNESLISQFLDVKQGFVTGKDKVFIRHKQAIKKQELSIYKTYLPDRSITPYSIDIDLEEVVFYPFINNEKIEENVLREKYPLTWQHLSQNTDNWMPHRPRNPKDILTPKIVVPYFIISPKFAIDLTGDKMTNRSPYLKLQKEYETELDLLYFFLGVLNTMPCFWYLAVHGIKAANGFTKLEVGILKNTPVPSPFKNINLTQKMVRLVKKRINSNEDEHYNIEKEIQQISYQLYNLSAEEIAFFERNVY